MAAAAILDFQNFKFLTTGTVKGVELHRRAIFYENPLKCGRNMAIFRFFQDGGRPPSWICNACVRTTREGHLVVFITAQNLVGIDAVVLKIWTFSISRVWLENAYSRPKIEGFGGFWPPKWVAMWKIPKKAHPCASPRGLNHHAWKSVAVSDLVRSQKRGINKNYFGYAQKPPVDGYTPNLAQL